MPILNKDMTLCISLAGRPSNLGTRFHNFLYDELGLNFIYKAFTTADIDGAIRGVRALGIRGCSVSMPFKEAVIGLIDDLEQSAAAIESVNTIVNDGGRLSGSNTDYEAVAQLLTEHAIDPASSVVVRGSGGMAKAVVAAFRGAGFADIRRRKIIATAGRVEGRFVRRTDADFHRESAGFRGGRIGRDVPAEVGQGAGESQWRIADCTHQGANPVWAGRRLRRAGSGCVSLRSSLRTELRWPFLVDHRSAQS